MGDALTDSLPRYDPRSQELAYNNTTDRYRMELPEMGDPASSGCVAIISTSGTYSIPVHLTSPVPVAVAVDIESDSIKVFSSSGTPTLPVYLTQPMELDVHLTSTATQENSWATLTEPSATASINTLANIYHTFQYTVSNIDTNVKVAASGSLDNVSWFNLDANDALTTQTANGTYGMAFTGRIKYALFSFMQETGGTNAAISARYLGGN